jgi:hypothetical protein
MIVPDPPQAGPEVEKPSNILYLKKLQIQADGARKVAL